MAYAEKTAVSVAKTKAEIEELVQRYGNHRDLQSALHEFLERNTLNGLQTVEIWDVGKLVEQ